MGFALFLPLLAAALTATQEPTQTFTLTTRLVEVSVSVTAANGTPIADLTKDDFELTIAGRKRAIAFLQFDGPSRPNRNIQPLPRHVFTNRPEFLPDSARNVTAIVIDTLNSSASDDVRLRAHLLECLRKMPAGSRVALYQLGARFRVLHDFTEDPEELRRRIASVNSLRLPGAPEDLQSLRADAQSLLSVLGDAAPRWQDSLDRMLAAEREQADRVRMDRMESSFIAMMTLARHLSIVPGRKSLIWAGGGLPLLYATAPLGPRSQHSIRSFEDWIQAAARRLAEANVVLYYYDTRGVIAPNPGAASQYPQRISEAEQINQDARLGTTLLAKLTGGRYVNYSNNVATALETAQAEQRASYTLSFYAGENDNKGWIPLSLNVRRPGVRVRHREGFRAGDDTGLPVWNDESLRASLASPLGQDSILMNARCEPDLEAQPGGVRLFLQIDAETVAFLQSGGQRTGALDVAVAELNAEGRASIHRESARVAVREPDWPRTLREGIHYQRRWVPHPDTVRIRVLLRDSSSGRLGTLDMPVKDIRQPSSH